MNAVVEKMNQKKQFQRKRNELRIATQQHIRGRCQPQGQNHQVRMRNHLGDALKSVSMRNVSRRVFDMACG